MGYTGNNIEAAPGTLDPNENRNEQTHGRTHRRARMHANIFLSQATGEFDY